MSEDQTQLSLKKSALTESIPWQQPAIIRLSRWICDSFLIEDGILWNVLDEEGSFRGQAAVYRQRKKL